MPQAIFHFPNGFLWGTATAAHQVEGQNHNNTWSAWEEQPGRILKGHRAGLACDWWGGRWREDFDRAAETHQNAHRLSVEWSRIQPTPDRWDEDALDHYREMIRGLVDRGLTPMVTIHHFTDPLWLAEKGGWENDETPALFATFARRVVEALKEYVSLWVTINEPNVYVYGGFLGGGFPPGKNDMDAAFRVLANMVRGHSLAYRAIHEVQRNAQVGASINYRAMTPARPWLPLDGWVTNVISQSYNDAFPRALQTGKLSFALKSITIPEAARTQDFIGVNYYTEDLVEFRPLAFKDNFCKRYFVPGSELSDTGFLSNRPKGMNTALYWAQTFKLPVYITENGVEDADDDLRPRYLTQHLHQAWRATNLGVPVKGYFHWSLVDNFEWERGWTQRFGLWGLDVDTQARIRRVSVNVYDAICQENGISSEMVAKYMPQIFDEIFPS